VICHCHPYAGILYSQPVRTKFDHSSFSRAVFMVDADQNLKGSRDLTTPHSGIVCHHWANTFTISLLLPNLKSVAPTTTKL